MERTKILIVCEQFGQGEKKSLGDAFLEAVKPHGITGAQVKQAFAEGLIIQEELLGKEWSAQLTLETCSQIGWVLVVGIKAWDKIQIQNVDQYKLQRVPQPRSWDDGMRAATIQTLTTFLRGWNVAGQSCGIPTPAAKEGATPAESKAGESNGPKRAGMNINATTDQPHPVSAKTGAQAAIPDVTVAADVKTDLAGLETFLNTEVANSRMQAILFNWSKDGGRLELRNAGLSMVADSTDLVPILVADDVMKNESKMIEVKAILDKAGYKKPYLMPVKEFMLLLRCYQIMAQERRLLLELVA